jgi:hypothetical protein
MSDAAHLTSEQPEPKQNEPYIHVEIIFITGRLQVIKCPLQVGVQYVTSQQIAFTNGLLTSEGWFTVLDTDNVFHAIRTVQIESIVCRLVMSG